MTEPAAAKKYLVRQYYPNFCSGFECVVLRGVLYDDITKLPWCKSKDIKSFKVEPYHGDELIISAVYGDGKSYVVAFALPEDSAMLSNNGDLMRDNWRYKTHIQNPLG